MSQILVFFFFCTRPLVSTQAIEVKSKKMRSPSQTSSSSYESGPDIVDLYSDADQRPRELIVDQKVDKTLKVLIFLS